MNTDTDQLIADLVEAGFGKEAGLREKHILRESLYSLVRLAKAEQLLEMKTNVKKLTAPLVTPYRSKDKSIQNDSCYFQYQLEFNRSN